MKEIPMWPKASSGHIFKKGKVLVLSALGLALIIAVLALGLPRFQSTQAANTVTAGDWPTYMHDAGRTGYSNNETIINLSSAPHLKEHWAYHVSTGAAIFSQPVVASGLIYWGSFDGYEHASNLSGQQVWSQKLGGAITQCIPPVGTLGIVSSAAVVNGVVYVGGSDHNIYALNAATGHLLWHTLLGAPQTNTFLWDSPLVVNNTVYIGTATTGEAQGCKLIAGQMFALNASNGAIVHTFNSVPSGCTGGGIWSSPVYDATSGSIYFTAGTQGRCNTDHISIGIVQLRASDLTYQGSWQIPLNQRLTQDADFAATPTLFNANGQNMVGAVDKNGIFYAFKRGSLGSGPVWQTTIAKGGACPQCNQGSISSAVWWGGGMLYVAGGETTINGQACPGSLRALNPANGSFIWQRCLPGTVLGAVTDTSSRVLAVVAKTTLTLVNSLSGDVLYKNNVNKYYGSASVSNGVLYVGSTTGSLYAFGT